MQAQNDQRGYQRIERSSATRVQSSAAQARVELYRGFVQFAEPLARTLGPAQRLVMNARNRQEVEFLANSATIALRIARLSNRHENIGAMLLRAMVNELHDRYGDGAATATVLARAMLREGFKFLAAGMNPAIMRNGIELGVRCAVQALATSVTPVSGEKMLADLATGVTADPEMGKILGEMFDILGDNVALITEEQLVPRLDREYISGGQWTAIPGERLLIPEGKASLELQHPLIMIVNETLETIAQVQPALELALSLPDKPPLLIVTREVRGDALNMLTLNHARGTIAVGVALLRTPILTTPDDLQDIATLCGGQVLSQLTGYAPQNVQASSLGRARKAVITRNNLIIADGVGEKRAIQQRLSVVRAQLSRLKRGSEDWEHQRVRLGRLAGGIGIVRIGAYSERERELKLEQVRKAVRVLDGIVESGVVPGGGAAYLSCRDAVQQAASACSDVEQAAGVAIVANALAAPFVQIVRNRGLHHPPLLLDEALRRGAGYGYDALSGEVVSMVERGILDSFQVMQAALEAAASLATMILTTESIVCS